MKHAAIAVLVSLALTFATEASGAVGMPTNLGNTSSSGVTNSLSLTTTALSSSTNSIFVVVFVHSQTNTVTITDQVGNSYTAITPVQLATDTLQGFYCLACASLPSGDTITATIAGSSVNVEMAAVSTAGVGSFESQATGQTGSANNSAPISPAPSTGTLNNTGDIVIGIADFLNSSMDMAPTQPAGFTALTRQTHMSSASINWGYDLPGATASLTYNPKPTVTTSRTYVATAEVFTPTLYKTTVNFGAETPAGFGGSTFGNTLNHALSITSLSSTCAGATATDFVVDGNGLVVPNDSGHGYVYGHYGWETALPLAITSACTYTIGLSNGTDTATDTINIIPNAATVISMYEAAIDADDTPPSPNFGAGSGKSQLGILLSHGALTVSTQNVNLGDTIYCRNGSGANALAPNNIPALNPTATPDYHIQYPTAFANNGSSGGSRITVISETPNTSTDANGNPVEGGGCVIGGLTHDTGHSGDISIPVDFANIWFYQDASSTATMIAWSPPSPGYGIGYYNDRFEIGPDVTPLSNHGVALNVGNIESSHFVRFEHNIAAGTSDTTGKAHAAAANTLIYNNIFENKVSDSIDVYNCNVDVENNFDFNPLVPPGQHADFVQFLLLVNNGSCVGGSATNNIVVRNSAAQGSQDTQFWFGNGMEGTTLFTGSFVYGNIYYATSGNIVAADMQYDPLVEGNTTLTDVDTNIIAPPIDLGNASSAGGLVNTLSMTTNADAPAGSNIFVTVFMGNQVDTIAVTDQAGHSYTAITPVQLAGDTLEGFYCIACTNDLPMGDTITATLTGAAQKTSMAAITVANIGAFESQATGQTGTGSSSGPISPAPSTATLANANDIVIGLAEILASGSDPGATQPTGFTALLRQTGAEGSINWGYALPSSTASVTYNPTPGSATSRTYIATEEVFAPALNSASIGITEDGGGGFTAINNISNINTFEGVFIGTTTNGSTTVGSLNADPYMVGYAGGLLKITTSSGSTAGTCGTCDKYNQMTDYSIINSANLPTGDFVTNAPNFGATFTLGVAATGTGSNITAQQPSRAFQVTGPGIPATTYSFGFSATSLTLSQAAGAGAGSGQITVFRQSGTKIFGDNQAITQTGLGSLTSPQVFAVYSLIFPNLPSSSPITTGVNRAAWINYFTPAVGSTFTASITGAPTVSMSLTSGVVPPVNSWINGPGLTAGAYIVAESSSTAPSTLTLSVQAVQNESGQTYGTGAMNPDGTYNGALWPMNSHGQVCWNVPGTVFNPATSCTPAT